MKTQQIQISLRQKRAFVHALVEMADCLRTAASERTYDLDKLKILFQSVVILFGWIARIAEGNDAKVFKVAQEIQIGIGKAFDFCTDFYVHEEFSNLQEKTWKVADKIVRSAN